MEVNRKNAEKRNKKEAKKRQEQEKKEQMERRKKENELKKNFQVRNNDLLFEKMPHLTKQVGYLQMGCLGMYAYET